MPAAAGINIYFPLLNNLFFDIDREEYFCMSSVILFDEDSCLNIIVLFLLIAIY